MDSSIQKQKLIEWTHLQQQYKSYKRTFHGRPIIPKQASTFLEFSHILTLLLPSFLEHYFHNMNGKEITGISRIIQNLYQDFLNKIKQLGNRLENKEIEQHNQKDVKNVCRVCLHELRATQITRAKQSLEGKQKITNNILKMFRDVENTQPFSVEEDRLFYQELRVALKKKEQVIEICKSQSSQFVNLIEEQLKSILAFKDGLIFEQSKNIKQPSFEGIYLKQNVTNSLKTQLDQKIPHIIEMVRGALRRQQQRHRKNHRMSTEVQTIDSQNSKILDFKRKITSLQSDISRLNSEKTKFSWVIEEKDITIGKYSKQLIQLKEQLDRKMYDYQKQIKLLEDKNRRLKEQGDKLKSKKNVEQEINFKTINSFSQLKQTSFVQEILQESQTQRRQKQKKSSPSVKSNRKYFLPTLKKINNQDNQSIMMRLSEKKQEQFEQKQFNDSLSNYISIDQSSPLNKTTNITTTQQVPKTTENYQKGKSTHVRKKLDRLLTISNTNDNNKQIDIIRKAGYQSVKTQRGNESTRRINVSKDNLPDIQSSKQNKKNGGKESKIKKMTNEGLKKKQRQVRNTFKQSDLKPESREEHISIKKQAAEISSKLIENAMQRRSSNSIKSISSKPDKILKESIYKKTASSLFKTQNNQQQDKSFMLTQKFKTAKAYLQNTFSRINEQVDKQNYQTPMIEQPASVNENIQHKHHVKNHLQNIFQQLSKEIQAESSGIVSIQKFSELFKKYVQEINSEKTIQKQVKQQTKTIYTTKQFHKKDIDSPIQNRILPKIIEDAIKNDDLYKETNFSSLIKLKKYQKRDYDSYKVSPSHTKFKRSTVQGSMNHSSRLTPNYSEESHHLTRTLQEPHIQSIQQKHLSNIQALLFINEQTAYKYEIGCNKKNPKSTPPLNPLLQQYIKHLFDDLEYVKRKNYEGYQDLSSFLRYPYSRSQSGILQLDIMKNITINGLTQCFVKIFALHQKCKKENYICSHLLSFKNYVQNCSIRNLS